MSDEKNTKPEKPWMTALREAISKEVRKSSEASSPPLFFDETMRASPEALKAGIELIKSSSIHNICGDDLAINEDLRIVMADGYVHPEADPNDEAEEEECEDDFILDECFRNSLFDMPPIELIFTKDHGICKSEAMIALAKKHGLAVEGISLEEEKEFYAEMSIDGFTWNAELIKTLDRKHAEIILEHEREHLKHTWWPEEDKKKISEDLNNFEKFIKSEFSPQKTEGPCRQCSRMNDTIAKKCWWCEAENPVKC